MNVDFDLLGLSLSFQLGVTAVVNKKPKNLLLLITIFVILSWQKNIWNGRKYSDLQVFLHFMLKTVFHHPQKSSILTLSLGITKIKRLFHPRQIERIFHWLLIYLGTSSTLLFYSISSAAHYCLLLRAGKYFSLLFTYFPDLFFFSDQHFQRFSCSLANIYSNFLFSQHPTTASPWLFSRHFQI